MTRVELLATMAATIAASLLQRADESSGYTYVVSDDPGWDAPSVAADSVDLAARILVLIGERTAHAHGLPVATGLPGTGEVRR